MNHRGKSGLTFLSLFGWGLMVDTGFALLVLFQDHPSWVKCLTRFAIGGVYSAIAAGVLSVVLRQLRKDT